MHRPVLVTAATEDPVTTDEAKLHLRVDGTEENTLIEALIKAAVGHLDGYSGILGRCLVTQTWRQDFDYFTQKMRLPMLAVGVTEVTYVNDAGDSATIDAANYELQHDGLGSFVRFIDDFSLPIDWAETRTARVSFTAGYGAAASVPPAIKAAILLLVGHWYANREAVTAVSTAELPMAVSALVTPYRMVGV